MERESAVTVCAISQTVTALSLMSQTYLYLKEKLSLVHCGSKARVEWEKREVKRSGSSFWQRQHNGDIYYVWKYEWLIRTVTGLNILIRIFTTKPERSTQYVRTYCVRRSGLLDGVVKDSEYAVDFILVGRRHGGESGPMPFVPSLMPFFFFFYGLNKCISLYMWVQDFFACNNATIPGATKPLNTTLPLLIDPRFETRVAATVFKQFYPAPHISGLVLIVPKSFGIYLERVIKRQCHLVRNCFNGISTSANLSDELTE